MIDTLLQHRRRALERPVLQELELTPSGYALCTIHRPSNVDSAPAAAATAAALIAIAARMTTVIPMHPRTRERFAQFGVLEDLRRAPNVRVVEPRGYLDFLALMSYARLVFTDSGGIQEETTALGIPCLTFRENTERPLTVTDGTNVLLGTDPARVGPAVDEVLAGRGREGRIPELWDGRASARIIRTLLAHTVDVLPATEAATA